MTGGLELALSCDFLIASERARFADTHARVGVMPGGGLTIRLPQLVGIDRARRMSFTGDFIDAETARDWGLVVEVVPHDALVAQAPEMAATIAAIPSEYIREIRRGYDEMGGLAGARGVARRVPVVEEMAGRALRPVPPGHRAREDHRPGTGAEHGTRRRAGVKVYAGMDPRLSLRDAIAHAERVERLGYDGLHVAETVHDALAVALLVAEHTERIIVRTSVALAFTRSPTLLAYAAWDISQLSGGRFELGLGTQIRQNIEDRYAVPFGEDPIGRLGDYVGAVRAAFASFASGEPPSYESAHYRLTRLQPYFNPGPDTEMAVPPIYLGGVQRRACELAGAVADGFVSHPTNSNPRYLRETCLPALAAGARAGGAGPGLRRVRDGDRDLGDHGSLARRGGGRAGAPAPTAGLLVLDPGLRADAGALWLDGAGATPARPDPPRPLGRPRRACSPTRCSTPSSPAAPSTSCRASCSSASRGSARASWCPRRPLAPTTEPSARSSRRCRQPEALPPQRGMGKISSSAAMASTAAWRSSSPMPA